MRSSATNKDTSATTRPCCWNNGCPHPHPHQGQARRVPPRNAQALPSASSFPRRPCVQRVQYTIGRMLAAPPRSASTRSSRPWRWPVCHHDRHAAVARRRSRRSAGTRRAGATLGRKRSLRSIESRVCRAPGAIPPLPLHRYIAPSSSGAKAFETVTRKARSTSPREDLRRHDSPAKTPPAAVQDALLEEGVW
jgi:hypothetical protein